MSVVGAEQAATSLALGASASTADSPAVPTAAPATVLSGGTTAYRPAATSSAKSSAEAGSASAPSPAPARGRGRFGPFFGPSAAGPGYGPAPARGRGKRGRPGANYTGAAGAPSTAPSARVSYAL
jgi:hypothetical protein